MQLWMFLRNPMLKKEKKNLLLLQESAFSLLSGRIKYILTILCKHFPGLLGGWPRHMGMLLEKRRPIKVTRYRYRCKMWKKNEKFNMCKSAII